MDIQQIRLNNYKTLLRDFANSPDEAGLPEYGRVKRFAEKTGTSARYLSHINNGRKNPGDDLCRELEKGLGLPHGWMDHNHEAGPLGTDNKGEQEFVGMALELYRQSPQEVQQALLRLALDMNKAKR